MPRAGVEQDTAVAPAGQLDLRLQIPNSLGFRGLGLRGPEPLLNLSFQAFVIMVLRDTPSSSAV